MKLKKILAGIIACAVVGVNCAIPVEKSGTAKNSAFAASEEKYTEGTYEQLKYYKYSDHIVIEACDESATEVEIPSLIEGLPVTNIADKAFVLCTSLTSVIVPDSITSIGNWTFYDCKSLKSITIPDSVTSIGGSAFYGCTGLTSVSIPDSVTSIGGNAFYETQWLKERQAENPLVVVNGILIDGTACHGDIIIPDSVTSIGGYAFHYCTSLTSITIPDSVTSIGEWTFYRCTGLTSVSIPDSVTSIGDYAFSYCRSLTSVTIPDSVTSIADSAFSSCTSLTSVSIPDSVTSIGGRAFYGCTSLTSITIPDSVTSIGYAFSECYNLESINVDENNLQYKSIDGVLFDKNGETLIQYPSGKKDTSVTIPDSVTSIGGLAFCFCKSLTSVTIPDSVTSIRGSAFSGCKSLTSVTIPDSVTSIDGGAFSYCTSLTSVTIMNPNCRIYYSSGTISNGYVSDTGKDYFNGVIYGYKKSTAQAYAKKYGYNFELLGDAPETTTTTPVELALGDVNNDGSVDSSDAAMILRQYADVQAGKDGIFTGEQKSVADYNNDGTIDSSDAAIILKAYAEKQAGK